MVRMSLRERLVVSLVPDLEGFLNHQRADMGEKEEVVVTKVSRKGCRWLGID